MAAEDKPSAQPSGNAPFSNTTEKQTAEQVNQEPSIVEANYGEGKGELLPSPEEQIDALGIPNWRELEKQVVKRLDMTLMPCLWVLYLFNYLDRASIAQARLSTLDEDLGLEGYQFGTAVSILSVGYVLGQIPSNMIIGKVRPSLYLCCMALVWSGVSAATCGVNNYQGLIAVRFFLGVVEAPLFPGAIYVMSCWYTRKEMALRCALLYTGQTLAFCTAGLIAAAVFGTLEGSYGLAGWQWLFIVLACTGAGLAMIALFILPDYPDSTTGSARWSMTEDMRKVAAARILADRVSTAEAKAGVWEGLKMSVFDYKMWLLVGMNIGISAAYGFSNFFPSIVRGFGYNNTITLVLTAPPYIFAAIGSLVNAWHSDKTKERGYHFAGPIAFGCIGYIICLATENRNARYGASFIYVGGMYFANPLISTWTSNTMGRTPEKRAISVALVNVLGQIGNLIAPYFFEDSDEPRYRLAFIMMMVMGLIACASAMGLKFYLYQSNKKLYRTAVRNGTVYQPYVM
ncbi:major facilitator superfamily transporter [Colletotrichum truncatum]|uniref:Major facilitator superfamily transporter n=1 Tax=Colletotrichum truncatum TaxID=5467 RepID=A0ACC3ZDC9_COLTU|nr:major facilitator superfamily transporter [Colletotrichum truncatum]KAF6798035.1 major facilitator superfamily transporter [Colletotrichum truncatum]